MAIHPDTQVLLNRLKEKLDIQVDNANAAAKLSLQMEGIAVDIIQEIEDKPYEGKKRLHMLNEAVCSASQALSEANKANMIMASYCSMANLCLSGRDEHFQAMNILADSMCQALHHASKANLSAHRVSGLYAKAMGDLKKRGVG